MDDATLYFLLCKFGDQYTWRLMDASGVVCESIPHPSEASCLRQANSIAENLNVSVEWMNHKQPRLRKKAREPIVEAPVQRKRRKRVRRKGNA